MKNQTQHTPGPWHAAGRFVLSGTNSGAPYVADCLPGHEYRAPGTTNANARLIAAAPELLALLIDAVNVADETAVGNCQQNRAAYFAANARAAIAKATGGNQ